MLKVAVPTLHRARSSWNLRLLLTSGSWLNSHITQHTFYPIATAGGVPLRRDDQGPHPRVRTAAAALDDVLGGGGRVEPVAHGPAEAVADDRVSGSA